MGRSSMAVALVSLATTGISAPVVAQEEARPPNVLLVIADDLNTRIGPYGGPIQTPNLDALASEGVTFERAYVQYPWCAPSRASFLTGMRPDTVGVRDLTTTVRQKNPGLVTLPQSFRLHGYFTARVGKIFHQGVPGGIGTDGLDDPASWDVAINPRGRDKDVEERLDNLTPGISLGTAMAYRADEGSDAEMTDGMVADEAIRLIEEHADRPFFIAAGFYRPHVPEVAPRKYFDLYRQEDIDLARETPSTIAGVLPIARDWDPDNFGMTDAEQRAMIHAYYAASTFVDAQVGRVLAALDRLQLKDDTIVVFLGDHGFMLGEHGQWAKNMLFEPSVRAPLIIRVPGAKGNGNASPRVVEFLDIYPTLLAAAGLPQNPDLEGQSLTPLLERPDSLSDRVAHSQVQGGRSIHSERYRYTEWEDGKAGRELFDLKADPLEHHNLAGEPGYAPLVDYFSGLVPERSAGKKPDLNLYDSDANCVILPRKHKNNEKYGCKTDVVPAATGSNSMHP